MKEVSYNMMDTTQEQWSYVTAAKIFYLPFSELMYQAQVVHRKNFDPNVIQISTLLSIKTGGCPEDCTYCPQSAHYKTSSPKEPLMNVDEVLTLAARAKASGSTRFCMGAAWRSPRDQDLEKVCEMIREVKKLGLETCTTLGLLQKHQANMLKDAGLDFYNHNIDTSREYYDKIINTRTFDDRLETLEHVRTAGIKVCCGGILGMGETNEDRINMLVTLANLDEVPESVPINQLIRIPGTPLANAADIDSFDFVRTIALARIMMPRSYIRLSAGREQMSEELHSLCFLAGANSIHYGEKLLITPLPLPEQDNILLNKLGLEKQCLS